jgi:hypothetical protein
MGAGLLGDPMIVGVAVWASLRDLWDGSPPQAWISRTWRGTFSASPTDVAQPRAFPQTHPLTSSAATGDGAGPCKYKRPFRAATDPDGTK